MITDQPVNNHDDMCKVADTPATGPVSTASTAPNDNLTRPQLTVIHYSGMGLTKITVGLFFFIPWVSSKMVLKTRKPSATE